MKLLLDTHTFIWLDTAPEKLSPTALATCEAPDNELYFSVVSAWEIQIKAQLGRLTLDVPLKDMVEIQQTEHSAAPSASYLLEQEHHLAIAA